MNVTLSETAARTIQEQMKKGRYATVDEAIEAAVARLNFDEDFGPERLAELRAEIDIGLAELDRGESDEFDSEAIKAEGRDVLKRRGLL